jgi:hypothetical protein
MKNLVKDVWLKLRFKKYSKKYTGIFAISTKGVIGYEVYKKEELIVIEWLNLLKSL